MRTGELSLPHHSSALLNLNLLSRCHLLGVKRLGRPAPATSFWVNLREFLNCKGKLNSDPISYATHWQAGWAGYSVFAHSPDPFPTFSVSWKSDPDGWYHLGSLSYDCPLGSANERYQRKIGGQEERSWGISSPYTPCFGLRLCQWLLPSMDIAPARRSIKEKLF